VEDPRCVGRPEQITAGQGDDADIDLSADGSRLVFSSFRTNVNLAEISLEPPTLGRITWLTRDSARGRNQPRYSPDGRLVAYFTNRAGAERENIWVIDVNGTNATRLVEDSSSTNIFPRWTANGKELFYLYRPHIVTPTTPVSAVTQIRRVLLSGGAPETVPIKAWSPAWGDVASDGRLIFRTSPTTGEIFDLRTKQSIQIPDLKGDPFWSGDGRSFAFFLLPGVGEPADAGAWIQKQDGTRVQVFRGWVVWIDWAPDGTLLVLEGKPDLKGILWRVADGGLRKVVLPSVPLLMRPNDVAVPVQFDLHPEGRRIIIGALESLEADLGVIDNVR
jgi:dipeptidyl aminopeptidase/acylaminoacyl peptidase